MPKFNDLLKSLNIDETHTKPTKKPKVFTKVRQNVPLIKGYNYMSDLLHLPETKDGYKYCLVVVDLANNEFDIEPLKTKEPKEVLKALLSMFKRKYIEKPEASIATDGGAEFKKEFKEYLYNNSIFHKVTLPDRHSQMSVVESLNNQLGRLFNGYMNGKEKKTGKPYNEWTGAIPKIRTGLNEIRKIKLPKSHLDVDIPDPNFNIKPKFKVGQIVYRKLEVPYNTLGNKQPTKKFRVSDYRWDIRQPRKITQVIPYAGAVPYRYMLEGFTNVSFTEDQLKLADKTEKDSKYIVKKIIGEKTENKQKMFLVWWDKYLKKDATWESQKELLKDMSKKDLSEFIKEFRESKKK